MKFVPRLLPLAALLISLSVFAADKKKPTEPTRVIDSGSFGIFVAGRRVATEKFEISQEADGNTTRAELKVDDGGNQAEQKSVLRLSATGDLQHYGWQELKPGKSEATVDPDNQFLMERLMPAPNEKPIERPFILSPSTAILDDYFFSQRELLAWRYLGTSCKSNPGGEIQCKLGKVDFGALIPRQRTSVLVSMQYAGREKVTLHGKQVELDRFNLQGEGIDWALWLDSAHMLQRVVIAADGTEVVRD
jgi:hypothetical protein